MLRVIFGLVGLLIVVAVVSQLGKGQLKLLSGSSQSATRVMNTDPSGDVDAAAKAARDPATRGGRMDVFPGASPAEPLNVQQQSVNIQGQVRDRVQENLQKGVQRSDSSPQQ